MKAAGAAEEGVNATRKTSFADEGSSCTLESAVALDESDSSEDRVPRLSASSAASSSTGSMQMAMGHYSANFQVNRWAASCTRDFPTPATRFCGPRCITSALVQVLRLEFITDDDARVRAQAGWEDGNGGGGLATESQLQ